MAAGGRRPEGQACSALDGPTHDAACPVAAADSPPEAGPAGQAAAAPPPPPLELPAAFSHRVPHFQQVHNWDCGLACVLMVLRALGMRHHNMATLQRLCPTHSIWTIDLAHLLAACGARVQMLTVTIGANQAYSGERFYAEHMPSDSSRVEALFKSAPAAGIPVHQRSLPLADLKVLLLGGACLPLVLVDKITLGSAAAAQHSSWEAGQLHGGTQGGGSAVAHCLVGPASSGGAGTAAGEIEAAPAAEAAVDPGGVQAQQPAAAAAVPAASPPASQPRQGVPMPPAARISSPGEATDAAAVAEGPQLSCPGSPVGYLGHYVVLVGYDARSDEFEYRDPSSDSARLWVPAQRLEAARKCFGTDEDLLLVEVPSGSTCGASAGSSSSSDGATVAGAGGAAGGSAAAAAGCWQPLGHELQEQPQQQRQQPDDWGAAGPSPHIVYG